MRRRAAEIRVSEWASSGQALPTHNQVATKQAEKMNRFVSTSSVRGGTARLKPRITS
jgi:hypothetical protein